MPVTGTVAAEQLVDALRHPLRGEAVHVQQLFIGGRLGVVVLDADAVDAGGPILAERLSHGAPETTDDGVLLDGHDAAGLLRRRHDAGHVKRLDGGHVDDVGIDAGGGEDVRRVDHAGRLGAGADERDVGALAHDLDLAELEAVAGLEQRLRGVAHEADEDRPVVVDRPGQDLLGLDLVGGGDDDHAGHGPGDGDVVHDLVRLAGLAREQAAVARGDLDVGTGLGDEHADLVQRPVERKGHEGADERHQADLGHARGHAEHVLLGDAHLVEALGIGILEELGLRGAAQVAVEDDDAGVVGGQLGDRLTEDEAELLAHGQRHAAPPSLSPSSAMAMANSSSVGTPMCHL